MMIETRSLAEGRLLPFTDVFPGRVPVCARTGRSIIARGELGVVRIGGRVFIPESELETFLRERFTPARDLRQTGPQSVEDILDRVAPRRRGRPRVEGRASR